MVWKSRCPREVETVLVLRDKLGTAKTASPMNYRVTSGEGIKPSIMIRPDNIPLRYFTGDSTIPRR